MDAIGQGVQVGVDRGKRRRYRGIASSRPTAPIAAVRGTRIEAGHDPGGTERDREHGQEPHDCREGLPDEIDDTGQGNLHGTSGRAGSTVGAAES
jgi:hypothetical protein